MIRHLERRSPRVRFAVQDAGIAMTYLVCGLLVVRVVPEVRINWEHPDTGPSVATVVVLVVGCAAVLLRRTAPVTGLVVATATLVTGLLLLDRSELGNVLAFADLLYCAVLHTPRRTAWRVSGVVAAAVAAIALSVLVTAGGRFALLSLINLLLLVAIPLVWGLEVRRYRELAEAERARAAEAEQAAARERDAAIAAERARMARDLHDVVAGRLSAIALQSEAALQPGADPELVRRVLGTVRGSGVTALGEMRTMIGLLRNGGPEDPPEAPARLAELGDLVIGARQAGLAVRFDDERPPDAAIPAPVELVGYRVVQESLTNAAKHAPRADVDVRLAVRAAATPGRVAHDVTRDASSGHGTCHSDVLVIEVRNGPGRTATAGPGLHGGTGLDGLRERTRAVGGTLRAGPDHDGWLVRAELPTGEGCLR
ncbi:histidine kinase [Pseudonocardia nematodicida]|uniref:histidine kinase n=1 Tax=Pseudonocardia nematodicida TaxID=1206997 RepID=A0ABV1K716_9PSEU